MGIVRKSLRQAVPVSRAGAAVWAWQHRDQISGWAGWATRCAPRVAAGDHRDVLAEGRLRVRLTRDDRTRPALDRKGRDRLDVVVREGVAGLDGRLTPEVHDVVLELATATGGIRRVRDDIVEASGSGGQGSGSRRRR